MLPDYEDIKALASRPPDWYDDHGVPRYAEFNPDMLGVYDKFAVLARIGCQGCEQRFNVGVGQPHYSLWPATFHWTLERLANDFHYGDPPRHGGCVGETMNCLDFRIIEAWETVDLEWQRNPAFEKELEDAR